MNNTAMTSSYDDTNLRRLFAELDPRGRRKAFKAAFRRTGAQVRKVAQRNVRGSGLHNAGRLARCVRSIVLKRDAGFRVTVAGRRGKKPKSMHRNMRGLLRPVLQWAENGTKMRRTLLPKKRRNGNRRRLGRSRGNLNRGRMPRYGIISRTRAQTQSRVTGMLQKEIDLQVKTIARRYGCTV